MTDIPEGFDAMGHPIPTARRTTTTGGCMTDDNPKLRQNDREKVLAVFTCELPCTARLLNAPRVTEEIVFGHNCEIPDDDELPPQEWYDRHKTVLAELVGDGILQTGDFHGETVYGLTIAYQHQLEQQALLYLENKAKLLRERAEQHASGMSGADLLTRAGQIEDAHAAISAPVVAKVQP